MDVSVIISKSRTQTSTSVGQKSDALMLADLNTVYKEIFSRLAVWSKKYTRQTYKVPLTVVWQSEYQIPKFWSLDSLWEVITGLKRVLNIYVKYSSDSDYIPCKIYDTSIAVDSEASDTNNPYCIVRDGSIFLYPAPTVAVTGWIVVDWQYIPLDLTLATTSANIKLPVEYHDILLSGLNMWNYWDKQIFDKQGLMKQAFEEWITRMIDEWWADIESAYETSQSEIIAEWEKFLP